MIRYFLKRISCSIIAVILAFAIVVLTASAVFVGCFSNEDYIAKRLEDNKSQIIAEINKEVKPLAKETKISEEAYVNAVNENNFSFISSQVAKNLRYCYVTDFSNSTELYSIYYNSISEHAKRNGKKLKSNEITEYASLAVYTASRVINAKDTTSVPLFRAIRGKIIATIVVGAVAFTLGAFISIELINKGRHRKFSYMGMGVTSAGYILIFGTLFVKKFGFIDRNVFLEFAPYNKAVQDAVNDAISMFYIFGLIFLVVGIIMLAVNYNYFRKKNIKAEAEKEFNKRLVTDFLEYDEPVSHRLEGGEGFEKEITKIDFD